jgi:hypothetical protein
MFHVPPEDLNPEDSMSCLVEDIQALPIGTISTLFAEAGITANRQDVESQRLDFACFATLGQSGSEWATWRDAWDAYVIDVKTQPEPVQPWDMTPEQLARGRQLMAEYDRCTSLALELDGVKIIRSQSVSGWSLASYISKTLDEVGGYPGWMSQVDTPISECLKVIHASFLQAFGVHIPQGPQQEHWPVSV